MYLEGMDGQTDRTELNIPISPFNFRYLDSMNETVGITRSVNQKMKHPLRFSHLYCRPKVKGHRLINKDVAGVTASCTKTFVFSHGIKDSLIILITKKYIFDLKCKNDTSFYFNLDVLKFKLNQTFEDEQYTAQINNTTEKFDTVWNSWRSVFCKRS